MLHIVLMLLKIIGIILAIILGILVLALCVVLFVPLRYRADAKATGSIDSLNVHLKFSWLFRLISGYVEYEDKKATWHVRVFWKKINQEEKTEENIYETAQKIKESVVETESKTKEGQYTAEGIEKKPNARKQTKKPKFFEKIKYTISNICDKMKMLVRKKKNLEEFLKDEVHQLAWTRLRRELFGMLKMLRPKRFEMTLRFGFEDPSLTGKVLAVISIIYPFYPKTIHITPDFVEKVLEGEAFLKGRIRCVRLLQILCNLFFDKNIRMTYKEIQKWKG